MKFLKATILSLIAAALLPNASVLAQNPLAAANLEAQNAKADYDRLVKLCEVAKRRLDAAEAQYSRAATEWNAANPNRPDKLPTNPKAEVAEAKLRLDGALTRVQGSEKALAEFKSKGVQPLRPTVGNKVAPPASVASLENAIVAARREVAAADAAYKAALAKAASAKP